MADSLRTSLVASGQTLVIYLFLVLALRRIGRRTMGQLTDTDFLIVALLGSAVETGLYAGSSALAPGLASATTLLVANRVLALLVERVPAVRNLFVCKPLLLVHNGELVEEHLRHEQMTEADLMTALRLKGYDKLSGIRYAVLEADGSVGVVPRG